MGLIGGFGFGEVGLSDEFDWGQTGVSLVEVGWSGEFGGGKTEFGGD